MAIDLPSGLDATTGRAYNPCIKATTTLALTVPKSGVLKKSARKYVGDILVSYMSVPDIVNNRFGISKVFSEKNLIFRI